jgi:glycosyltransferase involved in cell wall biosynthesis
VLCATDSLAEQIRPETCGHVATLPVIVDPPAELLTPRGDPGRFPHLLFVANLVANKRPLVFCETIQFLHQMGIQATGTILGDGPERPALELWCQTQNLTSAVRFLGRITNADVYRELALADGLVSTSYGEPYGRSIAEAMSVGTVPICHRSGGPADFVASGENGLLVDGLEGAAYADAIARSWTAPGTWKRLSTGALQKAGQWKPRIVIDQLEELLRDLLTDRIPSGGAASQNAGECRDGISSRAGAHEESVR